MDKIRNSTSGESPWCVKEQIDHFGVGEGSYWKLEFISLGHQPHDKSHR
jgi:hypothetical protein